MIILLTSAPVLWFNLADERLDYIRDYQEVEITEKSAQDFAKHLELMENENER